jgi:glycerol-3-phosphate dehydrogenase (NAD(P)+)
MSLPVCVLGAGNWGTTIAVMLARNGREVRLWCRSRERVDEIRLLGENRTYLPGVTLPDRVLPTSDLSGAVAGSEALLFAVPSQAMRQVARQVSELGKIDALKISMAKGIEISTLMRMTEVVADELTDTPNDAVAAVAGPSIAREVGLGMPTAVVASCASEETARRAQELLMNETFRVYTNTDIVGVELACALKNVIAIAAGVSDGLGYGDNTRGALVTRGLAEINRMVSVMGGRRESLTGLAGLGDLVTTCSSPHSRNHHVGVEIARGRQLGEIIDELVMVAEGVPTAKAVKELTHRHKVEMPICTEVHRVLFEGKDPREAIRELMLRRPRSEVW